MAVFAIDAGGTRIKLGLVEAGRVLARTVIDARSDEGLARALPRIANALRDLSVGPIEGVGMAFPSLVDRQRVVGDVGKYRDAPNLDLAAWAKKEFGAPFAIDNDARVATIGEWQFGAARGATDAIMVTLGTGIGTGVVLGGRVLRGRHGSAGILGAHMTAHVGGEPCPCGNVGCWETLASTAALRRAGKPDYATLFASTDAASQETIERSLEVWGALTVSLVHAYDPEVIVFGGGVMEAGERVLGPIRDYVARRAWTPWGGPRLVGSKLGTDAALLGCEWILEER